MLLCLGLSASRWSSHVMSRPVAAGRVRSCSRESIIAPDFFQGNRQPAKAVHSRARHASSTSSMVTRPESASASNLRTDCGTLVSPEQYRFTVRRSWPHICAARACVSPRCARACASEEAKQFHGIVLPVSTCHHAFSENIFRQRRRVAPMSRRAKPNACERGKRFDSECRRAGLRRLDVAAASAEMIGRTERILAEAASRSMRDTNQR